MALKKSADGSFDKRTAEYKEMIAKREKTKKANAKKAASSSSSRTKSNATSKVKKTADGTVDKRTKEGKAVAERMAKARASKDSIFGKIKRALK